jgi:hypothetical protein
VYAGFRWKNRRERSHLGNPCVDEIFRKKDVRCMDWIELAQDRDRWQAVVNAVMNLRVP